MNEKEALLLIEEMIHTAKQEVKDNGFYYMLWGWLVFIAALTDYTMLIFMESEYHPVVWAILMPLGGIITGIASIRESRNRPNVRTYTGEVMHYLMWAFLCALLIVCLIMPSTENNWRSFYPVLMVIYGMVVFVSGGVLKFKPLIIGGIVNWACAIPAFFVQYDKQLLLLATAVLFGFIVPGHLLKWRFNKEHVQGT